MREEHIHEFIKHFYIENTKEVFTTEVAIDFERVIGVERYVQGVLIDEDPELVIIREYEREHVVVCAVPIAVKYWKNAQRTKLSSLFN